MGNGLAYEALNHIGSTNTKLIIIFESKNGENKSNL